MTRHTDKEKSLALHLTNYGEDFYFQSQLLEYTYELTSREPMKSTVKTFLKTIALLIGACPSNRQITAINAILERIEKTTALEQAASSFMTAIKEYDVCCKNAQGVFYITKAQNYILTELVAFIELLNTDNALKSFYWHLYSQ